VKDLDDIPLDAGWSSRPGLKKESDLARMGGFRLGIRTRDEGTPICSGAITTRGSSPGRQKEEGFKGPKENDDQYAETESARQYEMHDVMPFQAIELNSC